MSVRFSAVPASNDSFRFTEGQFGTLPGFTTFLDVRSNDGRSNNRPLYSLDDGQVADLAAADGIASQTTATDRSLLGAAIWIAANGTVGYSTVPIGGMIESLAVGETLQDSFLYATRQANGTLTWSTVRVTITGTNDAPTAQFDSAEVVEGSVATGNVATNDQDVDNGAILRFATGDTPAGFVMATDGNWSFNATDPAYNGLAVGESRTINVLYSVTDQFGASDRSLLSITINGANDVPVIARVVQDPWMAENGGSFAGTVMFSDADLSDVHQAAFVALDSVSPLGTFRLDPVEAYEQPGSHLVSFHYDMVDAAAEFLGEGETRVEHYAVTVRDGSDASATQIVTVTIRGTNDAPVASASVAQAAESQIASGSLHSAVSDPDRSAVLQFQAINAPPGFALAANGSWTFDATTPAFAHLGVGDMVEVVAAYRVTDEWGASAEAALTISVAGTNDRPIAFESTVSATILPYPATTTLTGMVTASDVDDGAVLTYSIAPELAVFGFSMGADGRWSFTPNRELAVRMAQGESESGGFAFTVTDQHGASSSGWIAMTLIGSNDAPLGGPAYASVTEGAVVSSRYAAEDIDNGAVLTYSLWAQTPTAGFTVAADGRWSFDAAIAAYDYLADGQRVTVQVGIVTTDEHGATALNPLNITVTGINDAATISGQTGGIVGEARHGSAGTPTAQGALVVADPDGPATFRAVTTAQVSASGYGSFTLTTAGAWAYTLNNAHAAMSTLHRGQSLTDSFTVLATDGTAQVITIQINGDTDWVAAAPFTGTGDLFDYDTLLGAAGTDNADETVTGSELRDIVTGGSLAQNFTMLGGDDTVYARGGNDVVSGGAGYDGLYGQAGDDQLDGGALNDTLHGGSGNDLLLGGDGSDTLRGGSGADTLDGGAGMDFMIGGFGADLLTGGADRDVFIFTDLRDTGDTITDFQWGLEVIDFSALDANSLLSGDQAFAFSRNGAAAYSLWTVQNGVNLEIYGDTDGDPTTAEFMVTLRNVTYAPHPDYLPSNLIF